MCTLIIFHKRTKHKSVKYDYIREVIEQDGAELKYLQTEEMIADL